MGQVCAHCGQVHASYVMVCPATGASVQRSRLTAITEDELLVGSVLGDRYHVGDVIGKGTTGTVFAGEHLSFGRPCALKVLRPRYTSLEVIHAVFQGEARHAWRVVHPCLVEILDIGTAPDGAPFFVMEALQGETLAARLRRDRLSLASAVDMMMQLLSALQAIHAKDQLLRDLRPQNIYLATRRGCRPLVKLLDLGLTRLVPLDRIQEEWDVQRALVSEADTAGALAIPYYFSPERTRGDHGLSPSSDLFVITSIFYEALSGERPFVSGTLDGLLLQIARGSPMPLADLRPDVPADLCHLIARTLSSSPLARPASAKEMQDELRSIFEGQRRQPLGRTSAHPSVPSSMMAAASVVPIDSTAHTPREARVEQEPSPALYSAADQHPHSSLPSMADGAHSTDRPDALDELYADQTETSRKYIDITAILPNSGVQAPSSPRAAPFVDEASADNPLKTMRPPELGIDVEFEPEPEVEPAPTTSRETELDVLTRQLRAERGPRATKEDEETETMQLTPELRARIEQMARASNAESAPPPPTRRVSKPPR
jgi:serine/threonine protein kinase